MSKSFYLLKPLKNWDPWWDKVFSIVVRAISEDEARLLASGAAGCEGSEVWLDSGLTTCEKLNLKDKSQVICVDSKNG